MLSPLLTHLDRILDGSIPLQVYESDIDESLLKTTVYVTASVTYSGVRLSVQRLGSSVVVAVQVTASDTVLLTQCDGRRYYGPSAAGRLTSSDYSLYCPGPGPGCRPPGWGLGCCQ